MFGLPYKLIGIAALGLVLVFWAMFTIGQAKQIGALKSQLDSAIEIANGNAAAAQDQRAEFDRILAESVKAAVEKAAIRSAANQRRKDIANAPSTDDGPLAPVLRRSLDGLRGAESHNQNRPDSSPSNRPSVAAAVP